MPSEYTLTHVIRMKFRLLSARNVRRLTRFWYWMKYEGVCRVRKTMIKSSSVVAKSSGTKCTRAIHWAVVLCRDEHDDCRDCFCRRRRRRHYFIKMPFFIVVFYFEFFLSADFDVHTRIHDFIYSWFFLFFALSPVAHRWIDQWRWKRKASKREIENCHRNRKRRKEWAADACQSAVITWEWAIWWNRWIRRRHSRVDFQLQWVSFEHAFFVFLPLGVIYTDDLPCSALIFIDSETSKTNERTFHFSLSSQSGQHSHLSGSLHPAHAHMHGGWYASGMSALGASGGLQGGFSSSGLGGAVVPHSQSYHLMVSNSFFLNDF